MNETPTPVTPDKKSMFTNTIALTIVIFSAVILVVLIIVAWANLKPDAAGSKEFAAYTHAKELLNILLPVIGTWMGTILAFYFSKENYESANKQVKELLNQVSSTDEKLKVLKVTAVMTKPDDGMLLKVKDKAEFESLKLVDLIKKMEETQTERMPVLKADDGTYLFLIYRTTIERFLLQSELGKIKLTNSDKPLPPKDQLTMADLLNSDFDLIKRILAIDLDKCFLPLTATLSDARQAMQDNSFCQDVFITQTGKRTEKVEGWISNSTVIEKSELFTKVGMI